MGPQKVHYVTIAGSQVTSILTENKRRYVTSVYYEVILGAAPDHKRQIWFDAGIANNGIKWSLVVIRLTIQRSSSGFNSLVPPRTPYETLARIVVGSVGGRMGAAEEAINPPPTYTHTQTHAHTPTNTNISSGPQ